jgi:GTP-dependent phosphoenolpyruvate carboxykinase
MARNYRKINFKGKHMTNASKNTENATPNQRYISHLEYSILSEAKKVKNTGEL